MRMQWSSMTARVTQVWTRLCNRQLCSAISWEAGMMTSKTNAGVYMYIVAAGMMCGIYSCADLCGIVNYHCGTNRCPWD